MKRGEFIKASGLTILGSSLYGCSAYKRFLFDRSNEGWNPGVVRHILPTANHERFLIKVSFSRVVENPSIRIGKTNYPGRITDGVGRFWSFDIDNLEPDVTYDLYLYENKGLLCDPWPLKTFPHPDSSPEQLRVLIYTCAGGHPLGRDLFGAFYKETPEQFVSRRRALLERAMTYEPDAIIAIGDQIYWDLDEILPGIPGEGGNEMAYKEVGKLDESLPILNTPNEQVLKKAVDPQVAELYGTLCRSTPIFMLSDDHDYYENDNAMPSKVTFPPDYFNLKMARRTQTMYWPEFLPDSNRPIGLSGSNAGDKAYQSSETYGTLRYGKLLEMLMYDCRRFTSLHGPAATFIAADAEEWLIRRSKDSSVKHTVHIPSLPIGWSAGKWMEWYPDVRDSDGQLSKEDDKYFWQSGWQSQHDRILEAVASNRDKKGIFMQGDLHTFAGGKIYRSNSMDFDTNPIEAFIMGPLGSTAFPSGIRGLKAGVPSDIGMEEYFDNVEETGFSIVDFTESSIEIKMHKYLTERDHFEMISNLEPFKQLIV